MLARENTSINHKLGIVQTFKVELAKFYVFVIVLHLILKTLNKKFYYILLTLLFEWNVQFMISWYVMTSFKIFNLLEYKGLQRFMFENLNPIFKIEKLLLSE